MNNEKCSTCLNYDLDSDDEPCASCSHLSGYSNNWEAPVTLESINVKLDKIMEHFGIVG